MSIKQIRVTQRLCYICKENDDIKQATTEVTTNQSQYDVCDGHAYPIIEAISKNQCDFKVKRLNIDELIEVNITP